MGVIKNIRKQLQDNNNHMDPEQPDVLAQLDRLNHIHQILTNGPNFPEPHIRDYVSIYIQSHKRSEEFFTTLCEHKFLQVMLEQPCNPSSPTCYLQNLNLLLVNTKLSSQLVYFLSQNCLHQYLFGYNILNQSPDFIQYYVQLLKTILLKLSENQENKSLIKLFCNSKYPTFPILVNSTLLANDPNELVKVTAQQCVLILVGMINDRQLYSTYLQQLPMLAFFVKITYEYLTPEADLQGIIKFLADLIFQLRKNSIPLLLLANIISNVIITQSVPGNPSLPLVFVESLTQNIYIRINEGPYNESKSTKQMIQKQKKSVRSTYHKVKRVSSGKYDQFLQKDVCDELLILCATFYRVLVKFLTQKYLNSSYFANMIHFSPIGKPSSSNKLPILSSHAQWKLFHDFLPKVYNEKQRCKSEIKLGRDILEDIQQKVQEYSLCKDFLKLKENYLKKENYKAGNNSGFFVNFFKRVSNQSAWLKTISEITSINFHKGALVSDNFPTCLSPVNCPFIVEFSFLKRGIREGQLKLGQLKLGQDFDKVEVEEIHMNDIRDIWALNQGILNVLQKLTVLFVQFINEKQHFLALPKLGVTPEYLFMIQIKQFFTNSVDLFFNYQDPKNLQFLSDYKQMIKLGRICAGLNVKLTQKVYLGLSNSLNYLHLKMQTEMFQKGFEQVVCYLCYNIRARRSGGKDNEEQKYKPGNVFKCLCSYEVIQKIMDPNVKSILKHYEIAWKHANENDIEGIPLFEFEVSYFGKTGCKLIFMKVSRPPTILITINLHGKTLLETDIMQMEEVRKNKIDNRVVQLGSSVQTIRLSCSSQAQQVVQKFKQCKHMIIETVTCAALEYLSVTHTMLHTESKIVKPDRNALSLVTPG